MGGKIANAEFWLPPSPSVPQTTYIYFLATKVYTIQYPIFNSIFWHVFRTVALLLTDKTFFIKDTTRLDMFAQKLSITKKGYQGGEMEGGQCDKLMNNTSRLYVHKFLAPSELYKCKCLSVSLLVGVKV